MNLLYVWPQGRQTKNASGIVKKREMQIKSFEENGLKSASFCINVAKRNYKIKNCLPFYEIYDKKSRDQLRQLITTDVKAIYIRKNILDISFVKMLNEMREQAQKIKIILEIPTYPYDKEWKSCIYWPYLIKDRIVRNQLKNWVDRIVTFSDDGNIYGIKCINISNGFDCNSVKMRSPTKTEKIRLLAVASVADWHGYDRAICGLGKYYAGNPKRYVEFHIIGNGRIVKKLKKLCHNLNVEQYVFFHGWMHGEALDDMFNQCDIGVGSLGMYRIGLENGSTLKLREYVARGIPFFYGYTDKLIASCVDDYTMQVANNGSPIDIQEVISFYEKMQAKGFDKIAQEMRECAEEHLSWTKQMKPVVDYILSDER